MITTIIAFTYITSATITTGLIIAISGRAYPDVSALAGQKNPYCICSWSIYMGVAGTSAASPVVAGNSI